jgi:hypothetical protein
MSDADSYEVMVVEVKELGTEGLNVVVYDTRSDEEATVTTATSEHEPTEDDPEWRKQAPSALDASALLQYIDHEWRNASVEYTEEGLIKNGGPMTRDHEAIIVTDPSSLTARIERLADCFIVTVEADGRARFEKTYTDADLGLETHPALRD